MANEFNINYVQTPNVTDAKRKELLLSVKEWIKQAEQNPKLFLEVMGDVGQTITQILTEAQERKLLVQTWVNTRINGDSEQTLAIDDYRSVVDEIRFTWKPANNE